MMLIMPPPTVGINPNAPNPLDPSTALFGTLGGIVGGIGGAISDGLNTWDGVMGGFEAAKTVASLPPPKQRGNYCFGIDSQICEWVRTSPIGGWAYPACIVVTNTLCVVLGILAMVAVLGVAVYVLIEK